MTPKRQRAALKLLTEGEAARVRTIDANQWRCAYGDLEAPIQEVYDLVRIMDILLADQEMGLAVTVFFRLLAEATELKKLWYKAFGEPDDTA
jgi:hypothetical protein